MLIGSRIPSASGTTVRFAIGISAIRKGLGGSGIPVGEIIPKIYLKTKDSILQIICSGSILSMWLL
jgi:hypothetical protein